MKFKNITLIYLVVLFSFSLGFLTEYYNILPYKFNYLVDLLIGLITFLSLPKKNKKKLNLYFVFLLLFVLLASISAIFNEREILESFIGMRRIIMFVLLSAIIPSFQFSSIDKKKILSLFIVLFTIQPFVQIIQSILGVLEINPSKVSFLDSAIGTFSARNGTATVNSFIIFMLFYFFYKREYLSIKILYFIVGFVLCFSGGSYFLFLSALLVQIFSFPKIYRIKKFFKIGFMVVLLISLLFVFSKDQFERYIDINIAIKNQNSYYTDIERFGNLYAIGVVWDEIGKNRFTMLFGFGPGGFSTNKFTESSLMAKKYEYALELPTMQNSLAFMLGEFGLLGTCLYLLFGVILFRRIIVKYYSVKNLEHKRYLFAFSGFMVVYLLGIPYRSYWTSVPESLFYWLGSSFLLSDGRIYENDLYNRK